MQALKPHRAIVFLAIILLSGLLCLTVYSAATAQSADNIFTDDFSVESSNWNLLGSAYIDTANQTLVLTEDEYLQGGAAFLKTPIKGAFTATFSYKVGGGYQGDGFTMLFYKQQYSNLDTGDSLGFTPSDMIAPGYGIEFDGWQNVPWDFQEASGGHPNAEGDPSNSHIALIKDYSGNHLLWVNDSRVADNQWHKVQVTVQAASVKVYVDQNLVLEWTGNLDRTYDRLGFSAGTGAPGSNWHIIDDFQISAQNLQTPALTVEYTDSRSASAFEVQIYGNLTFNGAVIPDAPIQLSYSVTEGTSWQDLSRVYTKTDGSYSALWLLPITGNYLLKAVYAGSDNYLGVTENATVNIDQTLSPPESETTSIIAENSFELDWVKIAIITTMAVLATATVVLSIKLIRKRK
jgi:hypothetical protein